MHSNIAIIGGGSWATALASIIEKNVEKFHWYIYENEIIEFIKKHRHNPQYISSLQFDTKKIIFHNNVKEAIENAEIIIFVVPSAYIKSLIGTS